MTILPVAHNSDLDWVAIALRDDLAKDTKTVAGGAAVPSIVTFFNTVPDGELWLYERIATTISLQPASAPNDPTQRSTPSSSGTLRFFLDDDLTADTTALNDPSKVVAGVDFPTSFSVTDTPHPIRVPGGQRLGVAFGQVTFQASGVAMLSAHAQVTALRHRGARSS